MIKTSLCLYIFFILLASCKNNPEVDSLFYNGYIYTVDSTFSKAEAFGVKNGKIVLVGSNEELLQCKAKNKVDLQGKFVYPGFIDAHCHFYGYGLGLKKIWLGGTSSFEAVIDTLLKHQKHLFPKEI